jgi:drug/metabolite transporter (DMT)-like permease
MAPDSRLRWKTRLFLTLVVVSQPLGNLALDVGMKHRQLDTAMAYISAIFSPYVSLGILLLMVWMLARLALLSWADLSYVLPLTASGYVFTACLGQFLLHEHVSLTRWSGTLLIVAGTVVVGMTNEHTSIDSPGNRQSRLEKVS